MQPTHPAKRHRRSGAGPVHLGAILALLTSLLMSSCQHVPPDAGVEPLDAPRRWWNYYRRGIGYSLAGEWQKAALDFEIALGRRAGVVFGNEREMRRAKTYGLHTLDDYFPHRELGICCFHLGQLEAAERELVASLAQVPSARAAHYLNEVRRTRLRQAGPPAGPAIRIDQAPAAGTLFVNRLKLDLTGTASSPAFVARVRISGRPLFSELAAAEYHFSESVALAPGEQEVVVEAEDLLGQQTRWSCRVVVDLNGPQVAVARPPGGPAGEVRVTASDDRGLQSVAINGKALELTPAQTSISVQVPLGGLETLEVVAVDEAGNRTVLQSPVADLPQASTGRGARMRRLAGVAPAWGRVPLLLAQAAAEGGARADLPAAGTAPAGGTTTVDTQEPVVELLPSVNGPITVTGEIYVLDLSIRDAGGVVAVTYTANGKQESPVLDPPVASLRRLTHSVQLQPGPNEISVAARDRAGNTRTLALRIRLEPNPAWRHDLRATAQLLPNFRPAATAGPTVDLYPLLLAALAPGGNRDRLNLVERDPEVMRRVFLQLGLSGSSLADARAAIAEGKLKTSEYILVCRGTVWSGQDNFDLLVQVVDTATSEVLITPDVHFTSIDRDYVRDQLECLVAKIEQHFPRLTTRVDSCSKGKVTLPVGSSQRVLYGMYVLFLPGADDSDSSRDAPLEWKGRWVRGRVTVVEPDSCRVEIHPPEGIVRVQSEGPVAFR